MWPTEMWPTEGIHLKGLAKLSNFPLASCSLKNLDLLLPHTAEFDKIIILFFLFVFATFLLSDFYFLYFFSVLQFDNITLDIV